MSSETQEPLTPEHHALLFAWIAREIIQRFGEEKGRETLQKAVRRYGEQRGKRMGLRAQANGHKLNMLNYLAYGEWSVGEGEMEHKTLETVPHLSRQVYRCPWNTAWQDKDLVQYGRLYCLDVDRALVHGFNPELALDVTEGLPDGSPCCEFVFHDANLTAENSRLLMQRRLEQEGKSVMAWDYHTGHLYKTMDEVAVAELGQEAKEAVQAALAQFSHRFGEEVAQLVKAYQETDFDRLPG